jgi:hypothetical protein
MSVTPPEGSEQTEPEVRPGSIDNASLDRQPEPKKSGRSLDEMLSENIERFEKNKADEEAFERALPARDDLRAHYEHLGGLSETLTAFFHVYDAIKADPVNGSARAIEAFSEASFLSDIAAAKKPDRKPVEGFEVNGRRVSGLALDRAIELAMEKHGIEGERGLEAKDKITPQMRQRLDQIMPGLGLDKQLEIIADFNRAAIKDPYQGVAKLAVTLGLPTTPAQKDQYLARERIENQLDALDRHGAVPAEDHAAIAQILRRPDFVRTGDHMNDLVRAQAVVTRLRQQYNDLGDYADRQLRAMPADLAAETQRVLFHDPKYKAIVAANRKPFGPNRGH